VVLQALCAVGVQTLKVRRTLEELKEQQHELEEDYQEAQEEAEAAEVKIAAAHSRSAAFCPCTVFASQSLHTIQLEVFEQCARLKALSASSTCIATVNHTQALSSGAARPGREPGMTSSRG
jgi:phage shock protein A